MNRLERVLFEKTETGGGLQSVVVVKSDDVTVMTGGEEGVFRRWCFGLKRTRMERECELRLEVSVNVFGVGISAMQLNPTENYVRIESVLDCSVLWEVKREKLQ